MTNRQTVPRKLSTKTNAKKDRLRLMGTLFNQPERPDYFRAALAFMEVDNLATLKPNEIHALCDLARTLSAQNDRDRLDEQLAGFGELLRELVIALDRDDRASV
jgi:hypothetical protein